MNLLSLRGSQRRCLELFWKRRQQTLPKRREQIKSTMRNTLPIPFADLSKARVSCQSLAGIKGSNSAEEMDICLLRVLCVVRQRSPRRADPSSRGVLSSVVCLNVIRKTSTLEGQGPRGLLSYNKCVILRNNKFQYIFSPPAPPDRLRFWPEPEPDHSLPLKTEGKDDTCCTFSPPRGKTLTCDQGHKNI